MTPTAAMEIEALNRIHDFHTNDQAKASLQHHIYIVVKARHTEPHQVPLGNYRSNRSN